MNEVDQMPPVEENGHPSSSYLFLLAAISIGLTAIVLFVIG